MVWEQGTVLWGGLSPQLQGAIVGGLIGFVSSFVTGVFTLLLARRLRRSGKLRCEINAWSGGSYGAVRDSRTFTVRLLNEKEIGTALWNLRVVFYKDGKPWLSQMPTQTRTQSPIDVVDLPTGDDNTGVSTWIRRAERRYGG